MIVSVIYYDHKISGYAGREYTYKTELPLKPFQKVLVPVADGTKKRALVTNVDLPDSVIDPSWSNRVKEIKEYDNEENTK